MYKLSPMTPRVQKYRELCRNTIPCVDMHRYKLITQFYMDNAHLDGPLKRALNFRNLCENLPCPVYDDELIVGAYVTKFRATAIYPETAVDWLIEEVENGNLWEREVEPYVMAVEDREYFLATADFWRAECTNNKHNPYIAEGYKKLAGNGALSFGVEDYCVNPIGHFVSNFKRAIDTGFGAIKAEAEAKIQELEKKGIEGDDAPKYTYYRATAIVCDGMITYAKRYSEECKRLAEIETDDTRKKELLQIADTMGWVMDKPARNFRDAIQTLWFYHLCVALDGNLNGISMGRADQHIGSYAEKDIASGQLTREEAQELVDMYVLKVAAQNKIEKGTKLRAGSGYTTGGIVTVGGIDKAGNDATNVVTYMFLESVGRMMFHSPPIAMRANRNAPKKLWDCALAVNKLAGGVPSFYSDDVIMDALVRRGISRDDVWDYCIVGCVEPSLGGSEWPLCGGIGPHSFMNFVNVFLMAINNGKNPLRDENGQLVNDSQFGPQTGYLYEMDSIEEVKDALLKQMDFWVTWNISHINIFESVARNVMPQPVVSAAMEGCMENGRDVMDGGAKYNSTGLSGIGLGNVTDCLSIIDRLCFRDKTCTTRELYDAVMNNWEGAEELRNYINNQLPRYGNGDPEVDAFCTWFAQSYADIANSKTGPRGRYSAGLYPVTMNVVFGASTSATPDGRYSGEPLSDGISAVQGKDLSGPTAIINSVTSFDHREFANGVLLNMKFHPTVLSTEDGFDKLRDFMGSYFFDMGGGQMQMNIISADTLRDAQKHPDNYTDLIVRVAGFSAYFVEVYKKSQDDLISRTELGM